MRLLLALLLMGSAAAAQDTTISRQDGLAAWDRIYAVASHPRCSNCHVGEEGVPMWDGLGYGTGVVHGMNIKADVSRIGADTIPCRTCHITAPSKNGVPHAAPMIGDAWRLPPVELAWLGKPSDVLCAQLRDPDRNDGNDVTSLIDHLRASPFVAWGFAPGAGRLAPPGSVETLAEDLLIWGAADVPCE